MLHVPVMLVLSSGYCLAINLCQTIQGNEQGIVLQGHTFLTTNITGRKQCMRLCSQFKVCKSINFLIEESICQLSYATAESNSGDVIKDVGGSYLGKSFIPKEVAGACWGHLCGDKYMCIAVRGTGYICVLHNIKVCKNPPILPNTASEILVNTNPTLARYSCISRSGESPFQDNPFSTCIGFDEWTTPSVSCSNHDCWVASGNDYSYNGKRSYTKSGRLCLEWSLTEFASYSEYTKNYCEAQTNYKPWCYYENSKWEHCHVQEC